MRLSKRLEAIVDQALCWISLQERQGRGEICVADVGTDHGFVPISLVERGISGQVLALDVREGPLLRAREHVRERGLQERIQLRLGDGLTPLRPGEAQMVILTGMGGELMLRILEGSPQVREQVRGWIFSPQSEPALFRHGLENLGLEIRRETMLREEGKYYTIITAEPGAMHYAEEYEYRYGRYLIDEGSAVLREYLEREIRKLQEIQKQLESALSPGHADMREESLKRENKAVRQRLSEIRQELEQAGRAFGSMPEK